MLKSVFSAALQSYRHIAPIVIFRIAFGAVAFIGTIRFMLKGWVDEFYVQPHFHFPFYGFEWVKPFGETGMYALFILMAVSSLFIMAGLFYRISGILFFSSFLYVELIDKTYYLNHYYFITLIAFLLLFVPANRYFSLDVVRKPSLKVTQVPAWTINLFKLQLLIVYVAAGLSKITADWLLEAMPLKIWLPGKAGMPVIGPLLEEEWVAYVFSWFGMLFDLTIVFFLLKKSTRPVAYVVVVLFHMLTAWFFNIGMFPWIMMCLTVIFFSEEFHLRVIGRLRSVFQSENKEVQPGEETAVFYRNPGLKNVTFPVLVLYFALQILLPFRYLLYPGKLLWTEQGYRFSWRVMLMEKSGTGFFYVKDPKTGNSSEIVNSDYLTPMQEKMMITQPDMILQYAHYLAATWQQKGIKNPVINADCYVTLNGSGSRLLINPHTNLALEKEGLSAKQWILPFDQHQQHQ